MKELSSANDILYVVYCEAYCKVSYSELPLGYQTEDKNELALLSQ